MISMYAPNYNMFFISKHFPTVLHSIQPPGRHYHVSCLTHRDYVLKNATVYTLFMNL